MMKRILIALLTAVGDGPGAVKQTQHLLGIFSDDVGLSNISAYQRGMMDARAPNIDRSANDLCSQTETSIAGHYPGGAPVYPGAMILGGSAYIAAPTVARLLDKPIQTDC